MWGGPAALPSRLRQIVACAFTEDAEADIVAGIVRGVRVTGCGAQTRETGFPASPPINALGAGTGTLRISRRHTGQGPIEIQAPFPDVPGHIFNPKKARATR